ncbi:MAG: hypothetical protein ACJAV5_001861 [Vicingaceae bacterium]|jgi:hypothetical protein
MKKFKTFLILSIISLAVVGCADDDDDKVTPTAVTPAATEVTYDLQSLGNSGVSGTAVFVDNGDGTTTVNLSVSGTTAGNSHPAHIHNNTAAEGGGIAISLTPVDGATGTSSTTFNTLDDNTAITFEMLKSFDGYINIHLSSMNLATVVAQGDIGQNDLTGNSKVYALGERAVAGISGTVEFAERVNGEALATIALQGTPQDSSHPAHIHMNTAIESGGIAFTFNAVDGTTGMSKTNVATLNGQAFGYSDVLTYDGYVNVHFSATNLSTIVAQGDIGQNELTGRTKTYTLAEKDTPGISGNVLFSERVNGESLAKITLTGTPQGGSHPAHIHGNNAATTGPIVYTFPPVNGDSGISETNISALDDNTAITYDGILTYNGYINVHLSAGTGLSTIVAQGNIGSNE